MPCIRRPASPRSGPPLMAFTGTCPTGGIVGNIKDYVQMLSLRGLHEDFLERLFRKWHSTCTRNP